MRIEKCHALTLDVEYHVTAGRSLLGYFHREIQGLRLQNRISRQYRRAVLTALEIANFNEIRIVPAILKNYYVDNINEAIDHIRRYSTGHSEAIITKSLDAASLFKRDVDAAAVYVNASTRFTDGGCRYFCRSRKQMSESCRPR